MTKRRALLLILFTALLLDIMPCSPAVAQPSVEQISEAAARGRQWLQANQNADGSWGTNLAKRDTPQVLSVLIGTDDSHTVSLAKDWLVSTDSINLDYLARKVMALSKVQDVSADIQRLLGQQRPDGGFGLSAAYQSDPLDTALALRAMMATTGTIDPWRKPADFLAASRNPDGGWPLVRGGETNPMATAEVLLALAQYAKAQDSLALDEEIVQAAAWLTATQTSAGGWGEPGNAGDTALVVSALAAANQDAAGRDRAVAYLLSEQAEDGSWNQDAYATALALGALNSGRLNVSVIAGDVTVSSQLVNAGEAVTISARVSNTGAAPVGDLAVRFYLGDPQAGGQPLADQIIPDLPAGADQIIQYSWNTSGRLGPYRLYAVLDPDTRFIESTRTDNSSFADIEVRAVPGMATPLDPISGALFGTKQIGFSWANAIDISGNPLTYTLQIDTAPTFDSPQLVSREGIPETFLATAFNLTSGLADGVWYWRVAADNGYAPGPYSAARTFTVNTIPRALINTAAVPNPFSPIVSPLGTTIFFDIDAPAQTSITIENQTGEVVRHLRTFNAQAGTNPSVWDGRDDWLSPVPEGSYDYEITAVTAAGTVSSARGSITVDKTPPAITDFSITPSKFSPNNPELNDSAAVTYRLSEVARVTTRVYKGGQVIKTLENGIERNADFYAASWDGTDSAGQVVADGMYNISIKAVDAAGNRAAELNLPVVLDNTFGAVQDVSVSPNPASPGAAVLAVAKISGAVTTATTVIDDRVFPLLDTDGDHVYTADTTAPVAPGDYAVRVTAWNSQGQAIQATNTSLRVVGGISKSRSWTQTSFADFYGDTRTGLDISTSQGDVFLARNPWQDLPSMPTARSDFGLAVKNDKAYLVGGSTPSQGVSDGHPSAALSIYAQSSGTWTAGPPMPTARRLTGAAFGADGKLYVFGGYDNYKLLDTVQAFDPVTQLWETKQPMPFARSCFAVLPAADGKIYLIGGHITTPSKFMDETATVQAYDPLTDTWETKAPLPTRRARMAATAGADGLLYVVGGTIGGTGSGAASLANFERYDPALDSWTALPDVPGARRWPAAATTAANGDIFVVGGWNGSDLADAQIFSSQTQTWRQGMPMNHARSFLGASSGADGRVFAFGGVNIGLYGSVYHSNLVEAYDPHKLYVGLGEIVSSVFSVGRPTEWANLNWTAETPAGTEIEFQTRSSSDNVDWSAWSAPIRTSGGQITSPAGRYIQHKAVFTTINQQVTPKLSDVTVTYNSMPDVAVAAGPAGLYVSTQTPTLTWKNAPDYEGDDLLYSLQIDSTTTFDSADLKTYTGIAQDSGSTSFAVPEGGRLPHGSTWYWRVAANDGRLTGPWSVPKELVVDVLPPALANVNDWPDPFSPSPNGKRDETTIAFDLSEGANTAVNLYNAANGLAMTLNKNGDIPGSWQSVKPMPDARNAAAAITLADGRIMVMGGYKGTSGVPLIYDPGTDSWQTGARMPVPQPVWAVAPGPDGRVYAFGGRTGPGPNYQPSNLVQVYDPVGNSWSMGPTMPFAITEGKAALLDGKIYIYGNTIESGYWWRAGKFDPAAGQFQTIAAPPNGINFDIAPAAGKIYAFGGGLGTTLADVNAYDPAANTWTSVASMPVQRAMVAAVSSPDGLIYVIGGTDSSKYGKRVDAYDPVNDSWLVKGELTTATRRQAAAAAGNRIFIFGGDVDSYDASTVFMGKRPDAGRQTLSWDGCNASGFRFADGTYTYKVTATDGGGNRSIEQTGTVAIDNTPPTIDWVKVDSLPDAPGRPVLVKVRAGGASQATASVDGASAPLADDDNDGVYTGVWLGLADGPHQLQLSVEDLAGNESPLTGEIQVSANVGQPARFQTEQADFQGGQIAGLDSTSLPGDLRLPAPAWAAGPNLSSARTLPQAAADTSGRVHIIDSYNSHLHEIYDPATSLWQTAAPLPTPRLGFGIVTGRDGRIYLFGGKGSSDYNQSTLAQSYDSTTGVWRTLAPMPTGTEGNRAVVMGDKIYVVGYTYNSGGLLVHQYDPASDTWLYLGMLSTRRSGFTALGAGGKIYVMGGLVYNGGLTGYNQAFDVNAKTWQEVTAMPTAATNMAGVVDNQGKFWLIGGSANNGVTGKVQMYDPATDVWTNPFTLPAGRTGAAAVSTGYDIYLLGGSPVTLYQPTAATFTFPVGRQGQIVSSIIDTGDFVNWRSLGWTSVAPRETGVKLATRTSIDNINWSAWSAWHVGSGAAIVSPPGRYIQYKASLTSANPWIGPALSDVGIVYEETKPKLPVLEEPGQAADLTTGNPTFGWLNSDHAPDKTYGYRLQLDRGPTFDTSELRDYASITEGAIRTQFEIPAGAPLGDGLWYWRTAAIDGDRQSDWTPARALTVNTKPDLKITADDMLFDSALVGEPGTATVSAVIRNAGADVGAFTVAFYDGDPAAGGLLIASRNVASLSAGAQTPVQVSFDTYGRVGDRRIFAAVDPANAVDERSEANNRAGADLIVVAHGLSLNLVLDKSALSANETVTVDVLAANDGIVAQDGALRFEILDERGALVADVGDQDLADFVPADVRATRAVWGAGSTYAGDYQVKVELLVGGRVMASTTKPFVIKPDLSLDLKATAAKLNYNANEDARIAARLTSKSTNHIFTDTTLTVALTGPDGRVVMAEDQYMDQLVPDEVKAFAWLWPIGQSEPGVYTARVELAGADGEPPTVDETSFTVLSSAATGVGVTGHLGLTPASVVRWGGTSIKAAVANDGNARTALSAKVLIIDPESEAVLRTLERPLALAVGETTEAVFDYPFIDLPESKKYLAILQADLASRELTLDSAALAVAKPLDLSLGVPDETRPRVLVWADTRAQAGLAEEALDEAGAWYRVIRAGEKGHGRDEFRAALRSGIFNQYWLLGGAHPLDEHLGQELVEKVNAGATLVVGGADALHKLGGEAAQDVNVLGLEVEGSMEGKSPYVIDFGISEISETATVSADVKQARLKLNTARAFAEVATAKGKKRPVNPVAAINNYGLGRAVTFGFDPAAVDAAGKDVLISILSRAATAFVLPEDSTGPYAVAPVRLSLTGLGAAVRLRATASLPAGTAPVYARGGTVGTDSVSFDIDLAADATAALDFAVRLPKSSGDVTVTVAVDYFDPTENVFKPYTTEAVGLSVARSLSDLTIEAKSALDALVVRDKDRKRIEKIKRLVDMAAGAYAPVDTDSEDEDGEDSEHPDEKEPIELMLKALATLESIQADTSAARLALDQMLFVLEASDTREPSDED